MVSEETRPNAEPFTERIHAVTRCEKWDGPHRRPWLSIEGHVRLTCGKWLLTGSHLWFLLVKCAVAPCLYPACASEEIHDRRKCRPFHWPPAEMTTP